MWEDSWRFFKDCPMDTACASLPRSACSASVVQVRCLGGAARGRSSRAMRIRRVEFLLYLSNGKLCRDKVHTLFVGDIADGVVWNIGL